MTSAHEDRVYTAEAVIEWSPIQMILKMAGIG